MSKRSTPWATRRLYAFIKAHCEEYDIKTMCGALGVTRSGYYAWLHNPISNRAEEDARLLRLIRASFKASHGIYGSPRVFLDLREAGETCSKHRVARLMRVNQLLAHTTRIKVVRLAELLGREFALPWAATAARHSQRIGGGKRWVSVTKSGERLDLRRPGT